VLKGQQTLSKQLEAYNAVLPQEKGHIRTDRTFYKAGDDIWFAAYFLEHDLAPSQQSHYVRAELVAPSGTVEKSILLEYKKNGMLKGDFKIDPNSTGGLYTIRVQSNWMLQVADTQYIEKTVMVQEVVYSNILMEVDFDKEQYGGGSEVVATLTLRDLYDNLLKNKKINCSISLGGKLWQRPIIETDQSGIALLSFTLPKQLNSADGLLTFKLKHDEIVESVSKNIPLLTTDVDVQFLPEGGTIVEGLEQSMAFIAVDESGMPTAVKGIIVDNHKDTLTDFETYHDGMGSFDWTPNNKTATYRVIITEPYGLNQPIEINWNELYGNVGLQVNKRAKDSLHLSLLSNQAQTITVACQLQGKVYYEQELNLNKGKTKHSISTQSLPIGIAQITLFDVSKQPVAERLVFVNKHKQLQVNIKHKEEYLPREQVNLDIKITDQDSIPVEGLFSIAVVNEKNIVIADDKQANLLSSMLLTSDLKGYIHEPNFYFEKNDQRRSQALDYVLLTHGWRRFDWAKIQTETAETWQQHIKVLDDKCYVKGVATVNGVPLSKQKILLEKNSYGSWRNRKNKAQVWATTNSKGEFFLENETLDFPCYLSTIYRGIPTNVNMPTASTGRYTCNTIQSDGYNPSNYFRQGLANRNYNYTGSSNRRRGNSSWGRLEGNFSMEASRHEITINNLTGIIRGSVRAIGEEEPLAFANIVLHQEGQMIRGTTTDLDGMYQLQAVEAGNYTLVVSYIGMESYEFDLTIRAEEGVVIDIELAQNVILFANENGSPQVVTVQANTFSYTESASVGSSLSRIDRSQSLVGRMSRQSNGVSSPKPQKRQRKSTTHNLMRKRSVKPTQSMEALNMPTNSPYNRYHVSNSATNWQAEAVVHFDVTAVRVLEYYKPRYFYAPKHTSPTRTYKSDFRQTLYWNGWVRTDKDGKANLTYYNSDEVSTYRIMIEGIGNQTIGCKEKTYHTKEPVELRTRFPNVISYNDTVEVPLVFKNNSLDTIRGRLTLTGSAHYVVYKEHNLQLLPNSTKTIYATLVPKRRNGKKIAKENQVRVAFSNKDINVNQVHIMTYKVTAFPRSESLSGNQASQTLTFQMNGRARGLTNTAFRAIPNPLDNLDRAIDGILREPHGCFEQVSSRNFPNILVLQYMNARGIDDPERRAYALELLEKGYRKLVKYETAKGGFEWFGHTPPHLGLTAYGLIQFHEMQSVYNEVSPSLIGRVKRWILRQKDGKGNFRTSVGRFGFSRTHQAVSNAYTLYALSVVGERNVEKELQKATDEALKSKDMYRLGLLALAHSNYHNKRMAKQLLNAYLEQVNLKTADKVSAQTSMTNSYGRALKIEVFSIGVLVMYQMKLKKHPLLEPMLNYITANQRQGRYGNTQSTIWALKALTADVLNNKDKRISAEGMYYVTVNGHEQVMAYAKEVGKELFLDNLEKWLKEGENTITVRCKAKRGTIPLFSLDIDWYNTMPTANDSCQISVLTTLSDENVQMGETVRLTAQVVNKSELPQASTIAKIGIPVGLSLQPWQIQLLQEQKKVDYIELMDEFIVLHYRDMEPNEEHTIHLDLKTEFAGTYQAAASSAYLYYNDEQKHWTPGVEVTIIP